MDLMKSLQISASGMRAQGTRLRVIAENLAKAGPLPSELVQIVHKALARHREERYQSAGEFYQALMERGATGDLVHARQLLEEIWGPVHADDNHYLRIIIGQLRKNFVIGSRELPAFSGA